MKSYKGINGHEQQFKINETIIIQRASSIDFRDIEKELIKLFGIEVSHTTLRLYYNEVLNGKAIDKAKSINMAAAFSGEKEEGNELQNIEVDKDRLKELNGKYNPSNSDPIGALYAKVVGYLEVNVLEHGKGKAVLRTSYVKVLKDLKIIMKG